VRNYHLAVPHHELDLDKKKSLSDKPSLSDNLIIHGDNLKALKALLPHYAGRVKCIYIDPPYNTGNENWVYNDNVSSPRHKEWLGKVVDKDCTDRHDRWLSMMTPRLKLLKELLRDDGVIFISIDDNEVANLRLLMDEIFGEGNFIASMIWNTGRKSLAKLIAVNHEYCLIYAKQIDKQLSSEIFDDEGENIGRLWRTKKDGLEEIYIAYEKLKKEFGKNYQKISTGLKQFYESLAEGHPSKEHEHYNLADVKGIFFAGDISQGTGTGGRFDVLHPLTKKTCKVPAGGWRFNHSKLPILLKEDRIYFGPDETVIPCLKRYLSETEFVVPSSVFYKDARGASRRLDNIFGRKNVFDHPKDENVIKNFISFCTKDNDIILDSFAGSGTTAHAVLALNKVDGGNRKFILVEQEDYADTITAERVRRVIKGVKGAKDENLKKGLGGSFTYATLGTEYDVAKMLSGKNLPKYEDMAAYVFQTATGETLDPKKIEKKKHFIGSTKFYDVYLFYEPNVDKLKSAECALKLDFVESFSKNPKKKRLVFGAVRYVNQETLIDYGMEFCQLPYEVYRRIEDAA
jgi:adenine-specific DNA-methyltransferase